MSNLPLHARISLLDQRAREVTVFDNGAPDAGHFARVRERRQNGNVERNILRDIRDAEEDLRDQQLCARLLDSGGRQPLATDMPLGATQRTGFVAINVGTTRPEPAPLPSTSSNTAAPYSAHVDNQNTGTSSRSNPLISGQGARADLRADQVQIANARDEDTTTAGRGEEQDQPAMPQQPTSIKADSEEPAPRPPQPAETPDRDWVIESVRALDTSGRYRVRWKCTWERKCLLHHREKYGWFVIIDKQRWAIYRLSRKPTKLDDDGNELQKVLWKDSLFFRFEIPDAAAQIDLFHARQKSQQSASGGAFAAASHKLPRSMVIIRHMSDRFIPQPIEDLAEARRLVAQQWPFIIPNNKVDLYQAIWERVHETRLSANRRGKSFAELLNRKQKRQLRWSDASIKIGNPYAFLRPCGTYAILLQCTGEAAIPECEQCACGPCTFAFCVRERAKIWANGACASCYGRERGTLYVYHKSSVGIDHLDEAPRHPPRSAKIIASIEAANGPVSHPSWPHHTAADTGDASTLGDTDPSSESDSEDDRNFEQEADDDPSSDFGDSSLTGSNGKRGQGPTVNAAAVNAAAVSRERLLCNSFSQTEQHTLPRTSTSPPSGESRAQPQLPAGQAEFPSVGSTLPHRNHEPDNAPGSQIEEIDMTGNKSDMPGMSASHSNGIPSSSKQLMAAQDKASHSRSPSPSMAHMLAKLPQVDATSDVDDDLLRMLADDLVRSGAEAGKPDHVSTAPPAPHSHSSSGKAAAQRLEQSSASSRAEPQSSPMPSSSNQKSRKRRSSSSSDDLYSATPRPPSVRQRPLSRPLGTTATSTNTSALAHDVGHPPSVAANLSAPVNLFELARAQASTRASAVRHSSAPAYSLVTPPSSDATAVTTHIHPSAPSIKHRAPAVAAPAVLRKYRHPGCPDSGSCSHPTYGFATLTGVAPIEPSLTPFRTCELTRFHVSYILRSTTCEWTKMLRGAWLEEKPHGRYGCIEDFLSALYAEELWHALWAAKAIKPSQVDLTMDD